MLDRKARISWTQQLVMFINGDIEGRDLFKEGLGLPPLPFQRRSGEHNERLRVRAEKVIREALSSGITAALRRNFADEWLTHDDVATSAAEYDLIPLDTSVDFDDFGYLVATTPRVRSVDAFVALTIAEYLAPDRPVKILECALDGCERLFVRKLKIIGVRGHPGRKSECCCRAHSATRRTRRKRALEQKGKRKR